MNSTEPPSHPRRTAADADAVSPAGNRELELISENFPEGALYQYTLTPDGRQLLTYLGRGFERIFGERPAEMPAEVSWLTVRIHPDDEPGMAAAGEVSQREMTRFQREVRIRAADGTERWVSFRSSPRATADGSVVWDGAVIDVTERRQAEEAVRRQADFLAALNQTTLDLLGRRNVAELLHALVERAATLLRSPHAEISLLEGEELVVHAFSAGHSHLAGDRARRSERVLSWRAIDTRAPVVIDDYASDAGSRLIYRERGIRSAAVFPILRGSECMGVLGLAREQPDVPFTAEDVREATLLARMAALVLHNAAIHEEAVHAAESRTIALRESEQRFRVLAEVAPVGIFSSDPTGRCMFVNHRWCELAGMTPDQAMGEGWMAAVHPDDRAAVAAGWAEAVRTHESSAAEFRFLRPDGGVSWLVGQSRAHHAANGVLAGYVGTITDVTTLKRAEEERKKIEAQSRQSRKMEALGTLAGGIAHDFNNILTGTFGFIDLARLELPASHSAHTWLDRIAASSQRARELVRQILTFSRKNEGERVPQRLHVVIGEALRLLRSTLPPMVELETHIAPDAPPVLADATQVHQVVLNLCTNAWHAMGAKGGKIVVCLEPCTVTAADSAAHPELRPGLWTRLTVSDNGSGMDPATLEQIFEPFFTTKETGAGTGLGLAVVHGIVKSYDGTIVVRSAVGAGSTFELYFPIAAAEVERPAVPPPPMPRGNGERILVVDDDAVSGFALEKLIESLGYDVSRCTRPEEALARFAAAPLSFDLIVSDLAMPGMDGAELIRHLIQIRPELPVLIVSGYLETARQRLLEKSPARAILRKPVRREELARALAESLREVR